MSALFGVPFFGSSSRNELAAKGAPEYTGVSYHTSTQSIPIPIMWGARRMSPNIIWQSDTTLDVTGNPYTSVTFLPGGVPQFGNGDISFNGNVGVGSGGGPLTDEGTHWWTPTFVAFCEGPIIAFNTLPNARVWLGGGTAPITWSQTGNRNGSNLPVGFLDDIFTGNSSQVVSTFWTNGTSGSANLTLYPGQNLAYRFTAYLVYGLLNTGNNNVIPQVSYEVTRTPNTAFAVTDSYNIGKDYSLADIIPDLLTSTQYGVGGMTGSDIDTASLANFVAYQFAQGLYFSPLLDSQSPAVDIIDRWATIANTWIYWSGTVIMFAPLGDETVTANGQTYTPDTTPAYNLTLNDILEPGITVDRADPIDCDNRVRLEFCDRKNDYSKTPIEWKDTTLINLFGLRDASSIDGQDICDIAVAAKCVELIGKRMAYIRNLYTFSVSYRFIRILPGTIVTLTDPNIGLNLQPVRVRTVEEDDNGAIKIVAEEYPGTLGISRPLPGQVWGPSNTSSGGTTTGGSASTPGTPTPTSGGTLTMTSNMTAVLFVAGDVVTLPNPMIVGQGYLFIHDQQRSPQPTPALLEENPAKFQRPTGATYNIVDLYDRTSAPATSITVDKRSGLSFTLVLTADGLVRPL